MDRSSFVVNGQLWRYRYVSPKSYMLIDRTGNRCLATTDPMSHTIYLSKSLNEHIFDKVVLHELGHCFICSYGLDRYFNSIEAEEAACNLIADYGMDILRTYRDVFRVPFELNKLFREGK